AQRTSPLFPYTTLFRSPLFLNATAAYASAFVHVAVGDLDAADREIAASISAARAAHDPLRALRARLLRADVERRRGRAASSASRSEEHTSELQSRFDIV